MLHVRRLCRAEVVGEDEAMTTRDMIAKMLCAWQDTVEWHANERLDAPFYHEADRVLAALAAANCEVIEDGRVVAWLLENPQTADISPTWWHPKHGWTRDPNRALRFSREGDVNDYKESQRLLSNSTATEHIFGAPLPEGPKGEGK